MKKLASVLITLSLVSPVWAADSVDHSAKASKHSVLASAEGVASTAVVASAVVAAPVVLSAVSTVAVVHSGVEMAEAVHESHAKNTKPLKITTKVITRDPPPSDIVIEQTVNH